MTEPSATTTPYNDESPYHEQLWNNLLALDEGHMMSGKLPVLHKAIKTLGYVRDAWMLLEADQHSPLHDRAKMHMLLFILRKYLYERKADVLPNEALILDEHVGGWRNAPDPSAP